MQERPIELLTEDELRFVEMTPEVGFITDFENWAGMKTDASTYALKAAALMALSLSAGDVVVLPSFFGSQPIFMNLYVMLVGPSTVMRKTTVLSYVRDLLPVNEQTGQGFVRFMDDVSMQAFAREAAESGKMQSPVLLSFDEVAGLFQLVRNRSGSYLAGFDKTLLKAYDHSPIHIARVGRNVDVEEGAFVNVFAATTPEPLLEVLDGDDVESGLLPRFIIFDVRDAQRGARIPLGTRLENQDEWEEKKKDLQAHLARIAASRASGVPMNVENGSAKFDVTTLEITDEATSRLDELDAMFARELVHDSSGLAAIKGRAFWHITKLSGLYALSRGGAGATVELEDVLRAMWLMETTMADLVLMQTQVGANVMERRIQQVETMLKSQRTGTLKQSTVLNRMKLSAREAQDLLGTMGMRGLVTQEKDNAGQIHMKWVGG